MRHGCARRAGGGGQGAVGAGCTAEGEPRDVTTSAAVLPGGAEHNFAARYECYNVAYGVALLTRCKIVPKIYRVTVGRATEIQVP